MKNKMMAAGLALGLVAQPALAAPQEIDVALTFPKDLVYFGDGAKHMAGMLEVISDGDIKLNIHGAGDLVPALEVFNSVSSGAIPAGWDYIGYWAGIVPVSGLVGAMPFGPSPQVLLGWMLDGGGLEIIQRAYDEYNIKLLPCHLTAPEAGGWFNKEINTPEDLNGLKMRISGLGGKVLNKLGASTQLIPAGEIYVALERGRIDATEFSLPVIDKQLGFASVAKYYYFPGWHQPSTWNSMIINKDVWSSFDTRQQEMIWTACMATVTWSVQVAQGRQADILEGFEAEGVEVRRFPDSVLDALRTASTEVLEEEAASDPYFQEAYESLKSYIAKAGRYEALQYIPAAK
ncbi:MAG: TRAP transporter substrate-binding protein [Rhodovibrionaceae bacterium]